MRPPLWTHDRTHFYKYATREAALAILSNRRLRWSVPSLFNDPFDVQFDLHIDLDVGKAKERALEMLWDAHYSEQAVAAENALGAMIVALKGVFPVLSRDEFNSQFGEAIDESFKRMDSTMSRFHSEIRAGMERIKLLCLAEKYDNILMWSHYSEQHKGLCLRFKCVPEEDSPWGVAVPVTYAKAMPRLLDEESFAKLISGQASIDHKAMTRRLVYTKAEEWSYEKEWRVFAGNGRTTAEYEDILFGQSELDAVYLGCRMPSDEKRMFGKLVCEVYPEARVFEGKKSDQTFELIFT
jgi:hypothetical protein